MQRSYSFRTIEQWYPAGELETASRGLRLGGYLLESFFGYAIQTVWSYGVGAAVDMQALERLQAAGDPRVFDALVAQVPRILLGSIPGLIALLLYTGWWIHSLRRGQTPGKRLLGMYVLRSDGSRAGGGYMLLREVLMKGVIVLLVGLAGMALVVILFFMGAGLLAALVLVPVMLAGSLAPPAWLLWDDDRQTLWDKALGTYVAHSRTGGMPFTADELRARGLELPAERIAREAGVV